MNGLGKSFRKKSYFKKLKKNSKIKVRLPNVNKKPLARMRFFAQALNSKINVFSLYFKIRAKAIHTAKPHAFSLHFLFRRDQNHYSNLTSKIKQICEQTLKRQTAPKYNSKSLNCKKIRSSIIATWSC